MHTVVLVSPRVEQWQEFAAALEAGGRFAAVSVRSAEEALAAARDDSPVAMVVDSDLGEMAGVELVTRLLSVNAMINVALASDLPPENFHEDTEGLGLLMQLSPLPTSAEAGGLVDRLRQLTGDI